jgi:hypothetical protein
MFTKSASNMQLNQLLAKIVGPDQAFKGLERPLKPFQVPVQAITGL